MAKSLPFIIATMLIGTLTACATQPAISIEESNALTVEVLPTFTQTPTAIPTPTPEPPKVLTVCMGQEPTSLFRFADASSAARGILQAVYDGPMDFSHGNIMPVILESAPTLANGGAALRPIDVETGSVIVDALGNWVSLQDGVSYRPSGCTSTDCVLTYERDQIATMDELVVRFQLLPEILWADGTPLTAHDSVYSFSVARSLYGNTQSVFRSTKSYAALDERTVEWVSIPGYQGEYATFFFSPLPKHQLSLFTPEELFTSEISARTPLGWGPYTIKEWTAGDHITLDRNPNYFRSAEGLPAFDHLVFRFVPDTKTAVDALLVGECDYLDQSSLDLSQIQRLQEAQSDNQIYFEVQQQATFEQIILGINTLNDERVDFFSTKEIRQAITMCIDRKKIVDELLLGGSKVPQGYLFPGHVLFNKELQEYEFDPQRALELLALMGWVDYDQDTSTPLASIGVSNIPDFTPFEFNYLIPDDPERKVGAEIVKESLAQCGIHVDVQTLPWDQFLAPGPDGSVFGRTFDAAQFAWEESRIPPCYLYLSEEIPGPYPEYAKGWGGGNLTGYSNANFDQACRIGLSSLPDVVDYASAHQQAQAIYNDDLPVIPLYWHLDFVAMRPDMCGQQLFDLSNIETYNYGKGCLE
ncbi:MAG: hypothetical protein ISR58_03660 [Anaerolineales bacterium]|nr:hypothetical protein [Chloroflexota bacterium]MBL6980269.1 hypothetical protein [Anaerolineales bacterium]